jgi:hypothetical protein
MFAATQGESMARGVGLLGGTRDARLRNRYLIDELDNDERDLPVSWRDGRRGDGQGASGQAAPTPWQAPAPIAATAAPATPSGALVVNMLCDEEGEIAARALNEDTGNTSAAQPPRPTVRSPTLAAPIVSFIELDTDLGSTQLRLADTPPPAPVPNSATPTAYIGERTADATWLLDREAALIAVRNDYQSQLAEAQAKSPTLTTAGPGWTAIGIRFDTNDQLVPACQCGGPLVQVIDPRAQPQFLGSDEGGAILGPPLGQWFEFNEAAFAAFYQTRSAAQASSPLQTLAKSYDTDAAGLLRQHPEIWGIATSEHRINSGPAQAGRAMGDPGQLAMLDLYMADPQMAGLIQAYGGTPEPARSPIALEQVRLYGQTRYAQMTRLANAMQAVRDQYSAALHLAAGQHGGDGAGWVNRPVMTAGGSDESGFVASTETTKTFDPDAFTAWYTRQAGLANQAFNTFFGQSHTEQRLVGRDADQLRTTIRFDNPAWCMSGTTRSDAGIAGSPNLGGFIHNDLLALDLNHAPQLRDDAQVGFDPQTGWVTAHSNVYQKQDVATTVAVVAMVATAP